VYQTSSPLHDLYNEVALSFKNVCDPALDILPEFGC